MFYTDIYADATDSANPIKYFIDAFHEPVLIGIDKRDNFYLHNGVLRDGHNDGKKIFKTGKHQ
jgi:hypothetical protein